MAQKTEDSGTVGTSIRLPVELRAKLDALAAQERRTLGNMIRILLEDALDYWNRVHIPAHAEVEAAKSAAANDKRDPLLLKQATGRKFRD